MNELQTTIATIVRENIVEAGMAEGRCWIAVVRSLVGILTGASAAEIDAALLAGHRAGAWHMTRCDLVGAAPAGVVAKSEIRLGFREFKDVTFHFVSL